jgi:hypothetical protein
MTDYLTAAMAMLGPAENRLIALFCGFQVASGWVRPGSGRA